MNEADLQAMGDVLDELLASIDNMTATEAITMRRAVDRVKRKAEECISLLKTRALNAMEGQPVIIDETRFTAEPAGKWRVSWAMLRRRVAHASVVTEDGEKVDDPVEAASRAIDIMHDLYVMPSSVPKHGAMERLGVPIGDVAEWERGVPELKATPLPPEKP